MPTGIIATVDDGFATLDFVDKSKRGPALARLVEIGGPETIETITRVGPRRQYRVPEGNAREAGLLDEDTVRGARGLDASGNPDVGGGPESTTGALGHTDTGASAALKAADPNAAHAGADGPAATGAVNWHTPVAEHTSENAYVGQVPNATVLHNRGQVFTGTGTSVGGDVEHPATHAEVIADVKAYEIANPRSEAVREEQPRAAAISNALAGQPSALGSDPGGYAAVPEGPTHETTAGTSNGLSAPDNEDVVEYPEGEPSSEWRRDELDAYALKVKGLDTSGLSNKSAVLEAIKGA